jgi:hypothetical protein
VEVLVVLLVLALLANNHPMMLLPTVVLLLVAPLINLSDVFFFLFSLYLNLLNHLMLLLLAVLTPAMLLPLVLDLFLKCRNLDFEAHLPSLL